MTLTIISALFTLIGCPSGSKCDTGDSGCDDSGDADADTDTDTDTDVDVLASTTWTADGVTLAITNGSGTYALGMAETGAGAAGWYGEDCIEGTVEGSGDFDICHDGVSSSGITLAHVSAPGDVEANVSTLMSDTIHKAGNITYVVAGADACYVWGQDVSYYADYGCEEL